MRRASLSRMARRILLVHAYQPAMAPSEEAFRRLWPEAEVLNLLDESLYADVPPDGTLSPSVQARVASLLLHCELSRPDGIVFTGSTFGPPVERAREQLRVPVLKADEAMAEAAVARGERILLACTQKRAMPVLRASLDAAAARAGVTRTITELWVAGAREAFAQGLTQMHDCLIGEEVVAAAGDFDVIVLGQISMVPARAYLPPELAGRTVTSADAAVARMRALLER